MSEAFRLVETGGDPRSHPTLDYSLVLPLLLSRYTLEQLPFLTHSAETSTVLKYVQVDFTLVQRQMREELHLEKQHLGQSRVSARALEFERGRAEDRARIVLAEIERLRMLVHTLSLVREPSPFITALVANNPYSFFSTVDIVVRHDPMGSSKAILYALCRLAPHNVWEVRQVLMAERAFPNLATQLTIEMCHDEVNFMNRLLRGKPEWLTHKDPITPQSISSVMDLLFASLLEEQAAPTSRPDKVCRLLRILSGMTGLLGTTLSKEQVSILIDTLEQASGVSTVDLKVCAILMCAAQLIKQSELATSALALGRKSSIPSSPDPHSSHPQGHDLVDRQKLSSIATFCVFQLLKDGAFQRSNVDVRQWVLEQIRSTMLPLDENLVPLLRAYTTATSQSDAISRIPEQSIREQFVVLGSGFALGGATSAASNIMTPAKAILALYMLMNNEVYLQNLATDNYDKNAEYAGRFLESIHIRKIMLYVMQHEDGIAFKEIQPMFMKLATAQFPEMFDITTLLLEEEAEAAAPHGYGFKKGGSLNKPAHWPSIARPISSAATTAVTPFSALQSLSTALNQSIERPEAAVAAYHAFQRLSAGEMEQMAETLVYSSLPRLLDPRASPPVLEAFKKSWDTLNGLISHDLWAMTVNAVRASSVREVSDVISRVGKESEHKTTVHQPPSMASSFEVPRTATSVMVDGPFWTYEWLLEDPLLLFRVNARVFRQPVILRIFIQILDAIMVGSRHWLRKLFHASMAISLHGGPSTGGGVGAGAGGRRAGGGGAVLSSARPPVPVRTFLEPQLNTLLQLQESSLVQLVLEAIRYTPKEVEENKRKRQQQQQQQQQQKQQRHPQQQQQQQQTDSFDDETQEADQEEQDMAMKEVREIVFNFVHQLFINPKFQFLPKLLHFQGYKKDLIQTVVKGVPSIHVCLDFIQELMNQESEETQRFALRLAAQICDHLPLPKTFQMVNEFIMPKLEELLFRTQLTAPEVIKSAAVLCHAFPSLKPTLVQMLDAVRSSSAGGAMQPHVAGGRLVGATIEMMERMAKDRAVSDKSVL
ncbi:Integrator complex subunit 2 [Actinomortierella ambigua]|uniref:Integrator complex subunit 2 n=1 Tax=Actinomortierella ambigua TaxID=1343610 RepID=A0A9P6U5X1_9FUNG|nr:Integrator complex subunit 2 [Actinomortierella ambigua]